MRCANGVHELTDGEDLPDRADEEIVIGSEIDEHFARIEINDAESPDRVLVQWLVEDRLDVRGDVRVAAFVAASAEAEGGGHEE
jgi:predicted methyltransferase MtxX (methanogen marker protein 4)